MALKGLTKWINLIAGYKRFEQLLRHLATAAEQTDEGIVVIDLEGTLRFVNTAWARIHGYSTSKELLGGHISKFYTKEQIKNYLIPSIKAAKSRGRYNTLAEHKRMDGTTFRTNTKMAPVNDDAHITIGFIMLVTDINRNIKLEKTLKKTTTQAEQLKKHIEQLHLQVTEHAQAEGRLKKQADELAGANEQLKQHVDELEQTGQTLRYSDEQTKRPDEETAPMLDNGKLKELSEMAAQLAYPR